MQTALVTGASRGIGYEVAKRLAAEGLRVLAGTRSGKVPPGTEALVLDVTKPETFPDVRVDVLVNNAGIYEGGARAIWDTNVRGPLLLIRKLAPLTPAGGRIVNVTSGLGALSSQSPSLKLDDLEALIEEAPGGYGASKAALNALTRRAAREYPHLRVNSVCPGWVRTDMGGRGAPRSVEQGAASVLWGCHVPPDGPTGKVFRDGQEIPF